MAASGTDENGNFVRLWNLSNPSVDPTIVPTRMKRWVNEIAFSPDGRRLAATGREGILHLQQLDRTDGGDREFQGHEGFVWTVAFSPDGLRFASHGRDRTVRLWDVRGPDLPPTVLGRHEDDVVRVRFSPNGRHLASSSKDQSVRIRDVGNPDSVPVLLYGHDGTVRTVAYSPDGSTLATGSEDGTSRLWDMTHPLTRLTTSGVAGVVCDKVRRNLTLAEWHQFVGKDIPYKCTCPNPPIHASLLESAQ